MGWGMRRARAVPAHLGGEAPRELTANDYCFIRKHHPCGKIFGASKSCFIACPTTDDIEPILEMITEKLSKVGVEAVIAVKERAYGQDIFCTKICGRIIESQFCLAILDDVVKDAVNIPNPNVYYEYGLMTALAKHVVPLQKEGLTLAFNIQSYDTIKYTNRNVGQEVDKAIRDAMRITSKNDAPDTAKELSERSILRGFEIAGFDHKETDRRFSYGRAWFLSTVVDDTGFRAFTRDEGVMTVFVGKIDSQNEVTSYAEDLGVVIVRTEKLCGDLAATLKRLDEELEKLPERFAEPKGYTQNDHEDYYSDAGKRIWQREQARVLREKELQLELETNRLRTEMHAVKERIAFSSRIYVGFIVGAGVDSAEVNSRMRRIVDNSSSTRFELSYSQTDIINVGEIAIGLNPFSD